MERAVITRKRSLGVRFRNSVPRYILIAPAIVLLFVFHYLPLYGIQIAFRDFNPIAGITGSPWAGLKYFQQFLADANFWRVMRNTVIQNVYGLVFGFPFPIIFALMLNEIRSKKFIRVTQTISYLPHFISWVVVASIFTSLLNPTNGIVNNIIEALGGEPIYFLSQTRFFRSIIVLQGIWKGFGMSAVYYIAALSGIDQELYAAASIDGAGRLKQTWHITLPGLTNIIIVLFVLNLGGMLSIGFEQIFLMYNPMVYEVGDVISTYVFRLGLGLEPGFTGRPLYSYTAAISLTQNVIGFALVFGANRLSRKIAGWSLW